MSISISADVRKREGLSEKEVEHLEGLLEEIEKSNPSMPPEIYQPDTTISIETNYGGQTIDSDALSTKEFEKLERLIAKNDMPGAQEILKPYMEGTTLESAEIIKGGWIAHLSMPGYLDQTEPSRYDTLKEAIEELHSQFADNY